MRVVAVKKAAGLVLKLVPEGPEEVGVVRAFFADAEKETGEEHDTFVMLGAALPNGELLFSLVIEAPSDQVVN